MKPGRPVAIDQGTTGIATPADDAAPIASAPSIPISALRVLYRFLVRRRVAISLTAFTLILTTEGLLGVGWHRVNRRTDFLFGAAVVVALIGLGIRSWAAGTIRKNSELATSGAYSLCRHPLYLGSFLMIVGFCLGTQPQINLPIVAPLVVVIYICAIRSEERKLAQIFGTAWTNYTATTPRLLPNPLSSHVRLSRWSVEQWRSNREYQAVLGAFAGVVGMCAWYVFA